MVQIEANNEREMYLCYKLLDQRRKESDLNSRFWKNWGEGFMKLNI
jgi:hypothetical protein